MNDEQVNWLQRQVRDRLAWWVAGILIGAIVIAVGLYVWLVGNGDLMPGAGP